MTASTITVRTRRLTLSSATAAPADGTIVDLFEAQAARTPHAEAVRDAAGRLTYRELNELANRMAAHLRSRGVGPGQLVMVCLDHSIEVVCAILGTLKAGAAYVPVDPAIPKERLAFMLRDMREGPLEGVPVLVTSPKLARNVAPGAADVVTLDPGCASILGYPATSPRSPIAPHNLAYVIYTSGSTGRPKGVMIEHRSLVNYIRWAAETYSRGERLAWPLFSSLAFDLTVTSIFTPLVTGGRIVVYPEDPAMPGLAIVRVVEENAVDIVKLTPAHLTLIKDMDLGATRIRAFILGGEDLKTALVRDVTRRAGRELAIYNEYGPTEATVGCMIHRYQPDTDLGLSVPIGTPAANTRVYLLDEHRRPVPEGVVGEMYVAGDGLGRGYFRRPELTAERFLTVDVPRHAGPAASSSGWETVRLYRTGDLARWSANGPLAYLGRADHQVKIGGARVELGEIEARLLEYPGVRACVVDVVHPRALKPAEAVSHCVRCGLASNFPGVSYDAGGVCHVCRGYDRYAAQAQAYFKTADDLRALVAEMKTVRTGDYDCLVLLSGGKDSTYMLYQLCGLGLKPLVFTLDNGFISEEAKANIRRVAEALGVDLQVGTTPHMNEIFVDSLQRFANVCNGCFKTIYTLAVNLAHEKGIHHIVTGLSRGQFFETRLTEDVFERKDFDPAKLETVVLEARKAYHRRKDAVACHLEVDIFRDDGVFDDIRFVDFYRYWSVPLAEMHAFLQQHTPWLRPSDTGRSTNCLINDVGIYIHKKQRGFHNYALPYSWDVRLGQKTRAEAMAELDDELDEPRVRAIMDRIGYTEPPRDASGFTQLVAYYVSDKALTATELRAHLAQWLPDYMLPTHLVRLDRLPLTPNGKIDRQALPASGPQPVEPVADRPGPRTKTEQALAAMWSELLYVETIGIDDDFFDLGGASLTAIQAVSRIRDLFHVDVPLRHLFEHPTVAGLAGVIDGLSWVATAETRPSNTREREEILL